MRAVILAGGKGTRLAPYTLAFPKPLMPIVDVPILEIVLRQLKHHGFTRATLAVGHLAELLMAYFGDGSKIGLAIDYSREERPLGTAGPLKLIPDLDDTFLVMNGDLLTDLRYSDMMARHLASRAELTVGTCTKDVKIDLGVLDRDPTGRIIGYREKPVFQYEVSMGVYVFSKSVLGIIPDSYFDLPSLVLEMIEQKRPVEAYPFSGAWLDIGRQEDYQRAGAIFEAERKRFLP
jgi:NDP-mannose synthase